MRIGDVRTVRRLVCWSPSAWRRVLASRFSTKGVRTDVRVACGAIVVAALMLCSGCGHGQVGGSGHFTDRLELIPASAVAEPENLIVAMADLSRAAELADVDRPTDVRQADAILTYIRGLTGIRDLDTEAPVNVAALMPDAANVRNFKSVAEFEDEVGWSLLDVSWFIEYLDPLNALMVAGGSFEENRLTQAMGRKREGVWRLGPAEDEPASVGAITAARPFGQALRLVLDDDRLVVGRKTQLVKDATDDSGRTLADNSVLQALAAAMDDAEAYSALFNASGHHELDPRFSPAEAATSSDAALPRPFKGVAAGLASDAGGATVILAYVHDSDQDAQTNADALRRLIRNGRSLATDEPWRQTLDLRDIQSNGTTVLARLGLRSGRHPQLAYDLINHRESLVTHR